MKELAAFDFEPEHQPFEEKVTFRLKPLDMRGRLEIKSAIHMKDWWAAYQVAAKYVVGWSANLGEFSRARMREILAGAVDANWELWIIQFTDELTMKSEIEANTAKKS